MYHQKCQKKISDSLKRYNATHPRGKASDGSLWSQKISNGQKKAWAQIPTNKEK